MFEEEIFQKYDLLLPSKQEGGYLIILLSQRIKKQELTETFTTDDIKKSLEEISIFFGQPIAQSERVVKNLLHYFLRKVPNEYGVYTLTDHAKRLVELMTHKINNPYKNYPLKESFDKYFNTRFRDIQTITDLEIKFGSEFVVGHKRIINDHLESLEDELNEAYSKLKAILQSDELDATMLVKQFVKTFKTFGERAEDILNAITSKDTFLRMLRIKVDQFYNLVANYKHPETEAEKMEYTVHQENWKRANLIYRDLDDFFQDVDYKINNIRKRILSASDKLTELQENFAAHSNFRILIKRLFLISLNNSVYDKEGLKLNANFPRKEIIRQKFQLFYPEFYPFAIPQRNMLIEIPEDAEYEEEQRTEIEREIKRQEIINQWIQIGKIRLLEGDVDLNQLMNEIGTNDKDLSIAMQAVVDLVQYASENKQFEVEITEEAILLNTKEMHVWKMKLLNGSPTIDS